VSVVRNPARAPLPYAIFFFRDASFHEAIRTGKLEITSQKPGRVECEPNRIRFYSACSEMLES
jgi:hypothetical protein